MGWAHPMDLCSRVIAFVEEGHGQREAARHFRVSPRFVKDMVILKRETRGLLAQPQGDRAPGKLAPQAAWLRGRIAGRSANGCTGLTSAIENSAGQRNPAARHHRTTKVWIETRQQAITAVMRKLIVLANALLKKATPWHPKPA